MGRVGGGAVVAIWRQWWVVRRREGVRFRR